MSSGSAKSKDQRDVERRKRQIEKLPSPIALHDVQYPLQKTVLCDQHLQAPHYTNHLDTPELFNLVPPDDFFVYWNIRDCGRTVYPPLPEVDHRLLDPKQHAAEWEEHRQIVLRYLQKHGIMPGIIPSCAMNTNLAVVFGDKPGDVIQENFWFTAHCGNFMELKECQKPPVVRIRGGTSDVAYTLLLVSPDYPTRVDPNAGFFLHGVVANITADREGSSMIEYIPPLPTEDAGCARVLCLLFEQKQHIALSATTMTFAERSNFRLHANRRTETNVLGTALDATLGPHPDAISFFVTSWDIQVQEWYERAGIEEPVYLPADLDRILAFNAQTKEDHQISSKTLPDGRINDEGKVQVLQYGKTQHDRRRMNHLLSSRTMLSRDRKPYVTPS
jgi:hypothetical protein